MNATTTRVAKILGTTELGLERLRNGLLTPAESRALAARLNGGRPSNVVALSTRAIYVQRTAGGAR